MGQKVDYSDRIHTNHSKSLILLVVLIIGGYIFFFLSPYIFHEMPERQFTEIGSKSSVGDVMFKLEKWEYSSNQRIMQIAVSHSKTNTDYDYEVTARSNYKSKTKASTPLSSEIIFRDTDYMIVNVYNIPDEYYCVGIHIAYMNVDATNVTVNETVSTTVEESNIKSSSSSETADFYTCYDSTEKVETIFKLNEIDYKIQRLQQFIQDDKNSIEDNDTQMQLLRDENDSLRTRNVVLEGELKYKTSSEREDTEDEMQGNEEKIEKNNEKIALLSTRNEELEIEIGEYQSIIDTYIKESHYKPLYPAESATDAITTE